MSSNTSHSTDTPALGELATASHLTDARTPFTDLPRAVVNQILSQANLPDPADLANLLAMSRGMHHAVTHTCRSVKKLRELEYKEYMELGCVSALMRLHRKGLLKRNERKASPFWKIRTRNDLRSSGEERTARSAEVVAR